MSKKVVPALIALVVALAWLSSAFVSFPIFSVIIGIVAAVGVYELESSVGFTYKPLQIITLLAAAAGPIAADFPQLQLPFAAIATVLVIAILIIMVAKHDKIEFKALGSSLFATVCISYGFTCIVHIRDLYESYPSVFDNKKSYGMFFLLLAFFCSWLTDAMAYFAGSFFGKHKMCPKISPNKTVEGAVGGVIGNTLLTLVLLAVFRHFFDIEIGYVFTAVVCIILSVISIFGDLAASVIKRQNKIKDFGNLIPGTGGIMDRFDSSLFVMPLLYTIIRLFVENDMSQILFK